MLDVDVDVDAYQGVKLKEEVRIRGPLPWVLLSFLPW
jgi:hypothetical protein